MTLLAGKFTISRVQWLVLVNFMKQPHKSLIKICDDLSENMFQPPQQMLPCHLIHHQCVKKCYCIVKNVYISSVVLFYA